MSKTLLVVVLSHLVQLTNCHATGLVNCWGFEEITPIQSLVRNPHTLLGILKSRMLAPNSKSLNLNPESLWPKVGQAAMLEQAIRQTMWQTYED